MESDEFQRGEDLALLHALEHDISELEAALERIEAGSFASCEVCGVAIPAQRIAMSPIARACCDHHEANA